MLTLANRMGTTGHNLLVPVKEDRVDLEAQQNLASMAKSIASATASLVTTVRNIALKCEDQALQNQILAAAKQTAITASAIITCTNVLAPCIDSLLCKEQLILVCKDHASAVEKTIIAAQSACEDAELLKDLGVVATTVCEALSSLIQQIKEGVPLRDKGIS